MQQAVSVILDRYPAATLQDVYKSMFQDRFGVAHMLGSREMVRGYIERELTECDGACNSYYEDCGWRGDYLRVDLRAVRDGVMTIDELTNCFMRSAQHGIDADSTALAEWRQEWNTIIGVCYDELSQINGFAADSTKIAKMIAEGAYVVHHSKVFNDTYNPNYRIVHRKELNIKR